MKKASIFIVLMGFLNFLNSQTVVEISQGEGYTEDVYVSMSEGVIENVSNLDWDIAFNVVSGFADGIRINDGQNVGISIYPNGDINDWDAVDTSGFSIWPRMWNGIEFWSGGALNQGIDESDPFDFGWGIYTGDPLHDVVGDSLYVIQLSNGTVKKLRIDLLDNGSWTFTYANIDGTSEVSETFAMTDYQERVFVYYSMIDEVFIDREPSSLEWDMVFMRYYGETDFGPGITAGVLTNNEVQVAQANDVDVSLAYWADYSFESENISVIGNDWKGLNDLFEWEVVADRCYFVNDVLGDVYKVIFTNFEGSSTGNISYTTELVSTVGVNEIFDLNYSISLYPNPLSNVEVLNVNVNWTQSELVELIVIDTQGRLVSNDQIYVQKGVNTINLNTSNLTQGLYRIQLRGSSVSTSSFVIR